MEVPLVLTGILAAAALAIPGLEFTFKGSFRQSHAGYVTLATLLAAMALVIAFPPALSSQTKATALLNFDLLGSFFSVVVLIVATFVTAFSLEYMKEDPNPGIYYSVLLFTALGMVLLAFSVDLLMIFVAWELMAVSTYVLTGFRKADPLSNEAAIKFFVLGALSSGILLYAISLTYGLTASTNLFQVVDVLGRLAGELNPLAILAVALFIAGFGLKLAIVPFHMWIPDAYEGAPTTVSTLLAAGTKKAGFVVAIRVFMVALIAFKVNWAMTLALLAILTMSLGNIAALTQKSITRLLAYSSIAQAGYILIGLSVATSGTALVLGLTGSLFHIFNHAVMKSSAFAAAALVLYKASRADLDYYRGLSSRMPLTSFNLAIALLALAGIPPLNGFWSKFILFAAAIEANMAWLAIAGILNSAFSLGYYAWIIKRMYLDEASDRSRMREPMPFTAVMSIATLLIVLTGVYPGLIIDFANRAVLGLGLQI